MASEAFLFFVARFKFWHHSVSTRAKECICTVIGLLFELALIVLHSTLHARRLVVVGVLASVHGGSVDIRRQGCHWIESGQIRWGRRQRDANGLVDSSVRHLV